MSASESGRSRAEILHRSIVPTEKKASLGRNTDTFDTLAQSTIRQSQRALAEEIVRSTAHWRSINAEPGPFLLFACW
jgi:hypothetical protein